VNDKLIGAVDKILGLNTSAIVALGGLVVAVLYAGWVIGSLYNDILNVAHEQTTERLCKRILECPVCDKLQTLATEAKTAIAESRHHIDSHNAESGEWKRRIIVLEDKVYGLSTKATTRPDPFTGTMGRELEERIKELERKNP
jgi:hypothetical protein